MGEADEVFVVELFGFLMLPLVWGGDVYAPSTQAEDGKDVGFERIADHHERFGRTERQVAQVAVRIIRLVGHDMHIVEERTQARPDHFLLLIE